MGERELEIDNEHALPMTGNADELHRMVLNLLDNATRHTPAGARIELHIRRAGEEAVVEVADDGPGIPPTMREQVFNRFVRGEGPADTAVGPGSGLGLSIVRAVASAPTAARWKWANRPPAAPSSASAYPCNAPSSPPQPFNFALAASRTFPHGRDTGSAGLSPTSPADPSFLQRSSLVVPRECPTHLGRVARWRGSPIAEGAAGVRAHGGGPPRQDPPARYVRPQPPRE